MICLDLNYKGIFITIQHNKYDKKYKSDKNKFVFDSKKITIPLYLGHR